MRPLSVRSPACVVVYSREVRRVNDNAAPSIRAQKRHQRRALCLRELLRPFASKSMRRFCGIVVGEIIISQQSSLAEAPT